MSDCLIYCLTKNPEFTYIFIRINCMSDIAVPQGFTVEILRDYRLSNFERDWKIFSRYEKRRFNRMKTNNAIKRNLYIENGRRHAAKNNICFDSSDDKLIMLLGDFELLKGEVWSIACIFVLWSMLFFSVVTPLLPLRGFSRWNRYWSVEKRV